ncbi:chromosomal protein D1-like isoform X2 [Platichthys flesus]|nr:chromosomal protein D1-like isoform X2 [Platichthys flesus]
MEEEIKMAETEQGDDAGKEGESSADSTPIKRGRGRPHGLKKLSICVTDLKVMGLVSGISNGGSTQPKKGRGRPKLSITTNTEKEEEKKEEKEEGSGDNSGSMQPKRGRGRPKLSITTNTEEEEGSGDDQAPDSVPALGGRGRPKGTKSSKGDVSPGKRGRPKKSLGNNSPVAEQLLNGGSDSPKKKRGRPKGSVKLVSENAKEGDGSPVKRKRGRPKGTTNKKRRRQSEESSEEETSEEETEEEEDTDRSESSPTEREGRQIRSTQSNGISDTPQRRRGKPRKSQATDDSPDFTRGRLTSSAPSKRGRPRKYPLPTPEELNKPKEWKPLGRPRKYPRTDPPEVAPASPRRSRGRPPKTQSKKGAHLRKRLPDTSSPSNPDDDPPRRSRQPLSTAKDEAVVSRKRGRPKGSGNKNKTREETELDPTGDIPPVEEEHEVEPAEEEEHEAEPAKEEEEEEPEVQTTSTEHVGDTEEKPVEQKANFEVSDQA